MWTGTSLTTEQRNKEKNGPAFSAGRKMMIGRKKNSKLRILILSLCILTLLSGCAGGNGGGSGEIFEDMQAAYDRSGLMPSNIGIVSKTVTGDSVSYGEFGSGVIVGKEDGAYYALTAAHVVSGEGVQLLVFTVNTEMAGEEIPGYDVPVLLTETYESMLPAETVFVSGRDDLAVIRFRTEEELAVVPIAASDPAKGDRIMCIGNPQSDWFAVSYGTVLSDTEKFGESTGFPSNAMRHSAFMDSGSSGGAAVNERMELDGITPGGSYTPGSGKFRYGVLIPAGEIRLCLEEWKDSVL